MRARRWERIRMRHDFFSCSCKLDMIGVSISRFYLNCDAPLLLFGMSCVLFVKLLLLFNNNYLTTLLLLLFLHLFFLGISNYIHMLLCHLSRQWHPVESVVYNFPCDKLNSTSLHTFHSLVFIYLGSVLIMSQLKKVYMYCSLTDNGLLNSWLNSFYLSPLIKYL